MWTAMPTPAWMMCPKKDGDELLNRYMTAFGTNPLTVTKMNTVPLNLVMSWKSTCRTAWKTKPART